MGPTKIQSHSLIYPGKTALIFSEAQQALVPRVHDGDKNLREVHSHSSPVESLLPQIAFRPAAHAARAPIRRIGELITVAQPSSHDRGEAG
jgi:hypothetical protein